MLSIIIPTLNEEDYLPRLLESLKKQNYKDYEIIVADAGSKDTTLQIARSYNCLVVKGGLPGMGRNSGARVAKGDILLFLDSDTELPHKKFIENALKIFKKNKLDIAVFPIDIRGGKAVDRLAVAIWNSWIEMMKKVSAYGMCAFLVKNKVHKAMGGFDESVIFAEDQEYVSRMGKKYKLGIIKDPILISTRRYDKDGRLQTYLKYLTAEMHILFLGPIKSDIIKYKFGHYKEEEKSKKKKLKK